MRKNIFQSNSRSTSQWGRDIQDFKEAREFVHTLNLKSNKEWREYYKSRQKPSDIPSNPEKWYKNRGWVSWGDWLGTKNKTTRSNQYKSIKVAKEFVHSLGLKSYHTWGFFSKYTFDEVWTIIIVKDEITFGLSRL